MTAANVYLYKMLLYTHIQGWVIYENDIESDGADILEVIAIYFHVIVS